METKKLLGNLSERQNEIMEIVSIGKSNKQIADMLQIDITTVKKHLQNIFSKLGAKSRTEASNIFRNLKLKLNLKEVA